MQIVVVAEDGVTTNRYPIRFMLVEQSATSSKLPSAATAQGMSTSGTGSSTALLAAVHERNPGWPLPPAMHPGCSICPRGWAAGGGERNLQLCLLVRFRGNC